MNVIEVNDNSFETDVLSEKEKKVLVDFWAEWCGPCKMMNPIIEAVADTHKDKLKVCKMDTDSNPKTAQDAQITGIPCCILYENGKEIDRIVGYRSEDAFNDALSKHIQ